MSATDQLLLETPAANAAIGVYPGADERDGANEDSLHVTWVNQHAALTGGAEHYIHNTVKLLNDRGIRSSLLYDVDGEIDPRFTNVFAEAYPLVDVPRQLAELGPDLIYAHRVESLEQLRDLTAAEAPAVRFFHDHKLFCLREHKYTTLGHQTCTQSTGMNCYSCLGFLAKGSQWPGVEIRTLGRLQTEQRANQEFAGYVVGSEYMSLHVAAHGFDAKRIHTIPLYAPQPKSLPPTPRKRNEFLFAGALLRGKGLDVLIDAFAQVRSDAKLIIAGSGHQEAKFREQVERLGLQLKVQFVGRLSPEEMAERLQSTTCVVAPSRSPETFGLSGLEAQSYGAPVIASQVGGMGMWLLHERNGLFFPSGDSTALAHAMNRILEEEGLAERLGDQGRRDYQNRFTPEHHLELLTSMFRTVASQQSSSSVSQQRSKG